MRSTPGKVSISRLSNKRRGKGRESPSLSSRSGLTRGHVGMPAESVPTYTTSVYCGARSFLDASSTTTAYGRGTSSVPIEKQCLTILRQTSKDIKLWQKICYVPVRQSLLFPSYSEYSKGQSIHHRKTQLFSKAETCPQGAVKLSLFSGYSPVS